MQRTFKSTKIACYIGYFVQAIINNLSPILFIIFSEQLGISLNQIGTLILVNFLSQAVVDVLSVKIVDRIGYKKIILASHAFATVGLVCLGVLPMLFQKYAFGLLVFSTTISALGSGMIEVTISPIVDSIPSDRKEADMSLLHSFYCWGQMAVVLFSTIFIKLFGNAYWFCLPILWALIPLCNLFNFMTVPFMPTLKEDEKTPVKALLHDTAFRVAMVLMLCGGAAEIAMAQWASYFAETGLGVSKMMGDLLGPCMFAVLMGFGRLFFGLYGDKIDLKKAMLSCALLCTICYAATGLSHNPFIALLGCAVAGLSVSLFWPGTFSIVSGLFPKGGASMFGLLAILGDIGCSAGPSLLTAMSSVAQMNNSMLSDGAALKIGFTFATLFPIIVAISLLFLMKDEKRKLDRKK